MDPALLRFYQTCTTFYAIPIPFTRTVPDYIGTFRPYMHQAETNDLIEQLAANKSTVMQYLPSPSIGWDAKISAVDNYLSNLYRLRDSLTKQGNVRSEKPLIFDWKLYLGTNQNQMFQSYDVVFEIIMTLHQKALMHYYYARQLIDNNLIISLNEGGKQLSTASSVMMYLTDKCNKEWRTAGRHFHTTQKLPNPIETQGIMCQGLAAYFRACAQSLAVIKAYTGPDAAKSNSGLKCRLNVGVVSLVRQATESLMAGSGSCHLELLNACAVLREVFVGLAYEMMSRCCVEKEEIGNALGLLQIAKAHLSEQQSIRYNFSHAGIPKYQSSAVYAPLICIKNYYLPLLQNQFSELDRSNRFIHFQVIPANTKELPTLPKEAIVMNPAIYVEPPSHEELVTFVLLPKKSFFGNWFTGRATPYSDGVAEGKSDGHEDGIGYKGSDAKEHKGSYGAGGAGAKDVISLTDIMQDEHIPMEGASAPIMSDDEYARALQQQYDMEIAQFQVRGATGTK